MALALALAGLWALDPWGAGEEPMDVQAGTQADVDHTELGASAPSPAHLDGLAPDVTPEAPLGSERIAQDGPATTLRVRLENAEGPPPAGQVLRLERLDLGGDPLHGREGPPTDGQGHAAWAAMEPGLVRVSAPAEGTWMASSMDLLLHSGGEQLVALQGGPEGPAGERLGARPVDLATTDDTPHVTLTRAAGVQIQGRVVDHAEAPVAGARVVLISHRGLRIQAGETIDITPVATTLADGRFRFEGLRHGRATLHVELDGQATVVEDLGRLLPGDTAEPNVRLTAPLRIVGRVHDTLAGTWAQGTAWLVERALLERPMGHRDLATNPIPERGVLGRADLDQGAFELQAITTREDLAVVITGPGLRTTVHGFRPEGQTVDLGTLTPPAAAARRRRYRDPARWRSSWKRR